MKTLAQNLAEHPAVVLEAIARRHGLTLPAEPSPAAADWLAARLLEPGHLQEIWRLLPAEEQTALLSLPAQGNRVPAAIFQRRFGEIRRLGGGSLQRERPWQQPANVSESLWYRGLIGRGFAETPDGLVDCIAIPADLLPLLSSAMPLPVIDEALDPSPQAMYPSPQVMPSLLLAPIAAADRARFGGDAFLDDLATLLIHVQNNTVWTNDRGQWRRKDLDLIAEQWQTPSEPPDLLLAPPLAPGSRGALLVHCADQLDFLSPQGRRRRLNRETVQPWLEQDRFQQRRSLFDAWRVSTAWNDLCLTPGLTCIEGNWRNDPVQTRANLFVHLRRVPVANWYSLEVFIAALHERAPDFQRPDGNYDTWYLRDDAGAYLRGFDHWSEVEGRLLRYLWLGPLFWLGLTALDADGAHWSLTADGAAFLSRQPESIRPAGSPPLFLVVSEDFRVLLPAGARLYDRFRLARFAEWEASWLSGYRYRISQRGLRRAGAAGISPTQIVEFLDSASDGALPPNVRRALASFQP